MSKIIKTFKTGQDQEINEYLQENLGFNSNLSIFPEVIVVVTDTNQLATSQISQFQEEQKTFFSERMKSLRNLQFIETKLSQGETESESFNPETQKVEKVSLIEQRTINEKTIRVAEEQLANLDRLIADLKKNG